MQVQYNISPPFEHVEHARTPSNAHFPVASGSIVCPFIVTTVRKETAFSTADNKSAIQMSHTNHSDVLVTELVQSLQYDMIRHDIFTCTQKVTRWPA